MRKAALTALLLAAFPARSEPPEVPPGESVAEAPPRIPEKGPRRTFLIPVVAYLPETGFAGGASFGAHLYPDGAPEPTSLFATALYSTEGEGLLDLALDSALPDGVRLAARARALNYPDRFYGFGPDSQDSALEHFTRQMLELVSSAEFPVVAVPNLRIGPRLELRTEQIIDRDPGGELADDAVPGASRSGAIAPGIGATFDTRDHPFWPSQGSFIQAFSTCAPPATSRTGAYGHTSVELRQFLPLPGDRVLGFAGYFEHAWGEVPFTLEPRLGNTRFLRGIREGRYRDKVGWAAQSEFRSPLYWRFSYAAFAAVGDVAPRMEAIRLDHPKLAGGLGLRYRLTEEGANIRLDVAASGFGVLPYLLILEAF
jgi:hypothetical protein